MRFKLVPALWTAGQRLRQRWSPLLAMAICLVGLPTALVSAVYAGHGIDWGGLAVGTVVGVVLSGLASGAGAWLALAGGEDPWAVGAEGLSRAVFRLAPLAGLVLLYNLPVLAFSAAAILTHGQILGGNLDAWIWWSLSQLAAVIPAVLGAMLAPVPGILMFEGGGLWPAIRLALRMTRGSRPKLMALEIGRLLAIQAVGIGVAALPASLGIPTEWGLAALLSAVVGALFTLVLNQSYMQLHGNTADQPTGG